MTANEIQFMVEGPDAEKVAGELATLVQRHFDRTVTPVPVSDTAPPGSDKKVTPDWLDTGLKVAGFLVSLPGVAVAVYTLKEKLAARAKAKQLQEETRQLTADHPGTQVRVMKKDGTQVDFTNLPIDTVMDMFREATR